MTQTEALKTALEALEYNRQTHHYCEDTWYSCPKHEGGCANEFEGNECNCGADKANVEIDCAITAIKEALTQPEYRAVKTYHEGNPVYVAQQEPPKYRRGSRVICLETEEYCVIHISGTDRQWVKFPDSHIGVYTNEQVAELFELLPKEQPQQEPVGRFAKFTNGIWREVTDGSAGVLLYITPPQRKPLTVDEVWANDQLMSINAELGCSMDLLMEVARAIEAAHGIGDNT